MNKNYFELKDRLKFQTEWANYFSSYFNHLRITQKVSSELRKEHPLLYVIMDIYYLPINFLRFLNKLRMIYNFNSCIKEIDVLKKELELKRLEK